MGVLLLTQAFVATMSVMIFPTATGKVHCFCNSPTCPEAVCISDQRCFVKLSRLQTRGNNGTVSTIITYGCTEGLGSNASQCSDSSHMICCDTPLCNLPNRLRRKIQVNDTPESIEPSKCQVPESAMRVASVVAPSLLIFIVVLLSVVLFYKLSHYERELTLQRKNCELHRHEYKILGKLRQLMGWKQRYNLKERQHRSAVTIPSVRSEESAITVNCSLDELRDLERV